MDSPNAESLVRRISDLWLTLKPEQVREICKELKRDDVHYSRAASVVGELYAVDSTFFKLDEFAKRARTVEQVDPLTQPNSPESQAAKREKEKRIGQVAAESFASQRKFVESLPADQLTTLKAQFLEYISEPERRFYAARLDSRLPTRFVVWAMDLMESAA